MHLAHLYLSGKQLSAVLTAQLHTLELDTLSLLAYDQLHDVFCAVVG